MRRRRPAHRRPRADRRRRRAWCCPGVGAFGACMDALRDAGLEDAGRTTRSTRAGRSSASASACRCCSTPARRTTRRAGSASSPAPSAGSPAGAAAAADAVEPADAGRSRTIRCSPGSATQPWVYFVHSLHGVPDDPATVAATCDYGGDVNAAFRQGNVFATQFHPEKSGACGPRAARPTSCASCRDRGVTMIELYPAIDLRGGQVVRLRRATTTDETVYGDDPVAVAALVRRRRRAVDPRRRPRRRAIGLAGEPAGRGRDRRRGAPVGPGCRPVAACAPSPTRRAGRRRRRPGGDGLGRGAASRARRAASPRSCPSRSVSTTATARSPCTAGPRASGVSARRRARAGSRRRAAFVITDIGRDGMLAGPDIDGLAAAAARADVPGDRQRRRRHRSPTSRRSPRVAGHRRGHHRQGALRGPVHRGRGAARCWSAR